MIELYLGNGKIIDIELETASGAAVNNATPTASLLDAGKEFPAVEGTTYTDLPFTSNGRRGGYRIELPALDPDQFTVGDKCWLRISGVSGLQVDIACVVANREQ